MSGFSFQWGLPHTGVLGQGPFTSMQKAKQAHDAVHNADEQRDQKTDEFFHASIVGGLMGCGHPHIWEWLLLDPIQVPFGADQQIGADDGIRGEAAFAEVVLGEDLEGFARLHHDTQALFVLEVEFAIGGEQ